MIEISLFHGTSAWRSINLIIRVKWQYKYLNSTSCPNKIVHNKANKYATKINLAESKPLAYIAPFPIN